MLIAKTKLIYTDEDGKRVSVDAKSKITEGMKIPKKTMQRFKDLGSVGEESESEKIVEEKKKEDPKKDQEKDKDAASKPALNPSK